MKAEPGQLIPLKPAENLELLIVVKARNLDIPERTYKRYATLMKKNK